MRTKAVAVLLAVSSAALVPSVAEARRARATRLEPLTLTGTILLAAGIVALGTGAAFHVQTKRADRRFHETFDQNGPTGFSTTTWSEAIVYRKHTERLGAATAISYGFAILAVPIGSVMIATGVHRARRATVAPLLSVRGVGVALRVGF